MDLSQSTTKWLALGLLRSSEFAGMALSRLELRDFRDNEPLLKILFQITEKWHNSNKTEPVPKEMAVSVLCDELIPNKVLTEAQAIELGNLLEWAYDEVQDVKSYKNFLLDELSKFVIDRKVRPAAAGLDRHTDIIESLQELTKTVAKSTISKARLVDPFASETPMLNSAKRIPWGVDWIDIITDGGSLPGETTLLLAPSGGGKTLTNIQIATTCALNGDEAVIITYEQGVLGIVNRIYAFAMGVPLSTFHGLSQKGFEGDRAMQAKYQEVRNRLNGKIKIIDQVDAAQTSAGGGAGGAAEVQAIIKQIQDEGGNPRYIGIDWLGPMVNNYMAARNISEGELTKVMSNTVDSLRKVGTNTNVNIWVYHQLGTEASKSGPRTKPQATDAYMCKTLHHYMDNCICIGNRDKESNIAWANTPKVRNGVPFQDILIQMEGSLSRWRTVDAGMVNRETMKLHGDDDDAFSGSESKPRKLVKASSNFNDSVRAHLG